MRGKYLKAVGLAILCLGFMAAAPQSKAAPIELLNVTNTVWFYQTNNTDQGTAWRALGFDAAAAGWPSGNGLFGIETTAGTDYGTPGTILLGGTRFNTQWPPPAGSGITIYTRSTFNWVGSTAGLVLTGTLRIDDGAVIYINGVEAYRDNMPAAPAVINFDTQATAANPGGEPRIVTISFTSAAVVSGVNEIAIEIHQNGTGSSDVVFGLDLFGDVAVPPSFDNPLEPADAAIEEGRSITLIGNASGLPTPTYQWFRGAVPGVAIAGATGPTYTIPVMSAADAGIYYVEASNSAATTRSRLANISFFEDVTPPVLVDAYFFQGKVVATFNELMTNAFFDAFAMSVYPEGGDPFFDALGYPDFPSIASGYLTNVPPSTLSNRWVWTTTEAPAPGVRYMLDIYAGGVRDNWENDSAVDFSVLMPNISEVIFFSFDSNWKFNESGTDFHVTVPDFNDVAFDDTAWPSGPGMHGTEPNLGPGNTVVPGYSIQTPMLNAGAGGPLFTSYLRKTFTLPVAVANISNARLRFVHDDGVAIYLNGAEIGRENLAAGAGFATAAASHEADEINTITVTGLVDGPNTLAVEVHDTTADSSDRVWGAELLAEAEVVATDPTITDPLPAVQTVPEGTSVTYSVSVTGGFPFPTFQWYLDGVAIDGATAQTYNIAAAGPDDAGTYTVVASNGSANPDTSAGAVLNVTSDTIRPVLNRAIAALPLDTIYLEFSEAIDEENGTNVASYAVALRSGGGALTINSATMGAGNTSVTLDTSDRLPSQNYAITITGLIDTSAAGNLINPNPTVANVWSEVIVLDTGAADTWRYFDTFAAGDTVGLDGQAWQTAAFNDSTWEVGAPLFYAKRGTPGATDIPTRTPYPTMNLSNTTDTAQIPAVYFRKSFTFPDNPATTPVRLHYISDDGLVVYFNGTEVHRFGFDDTPGAISFATLADTTQGNDMVFEDSVGVSAAALTQGAGNLIAAEVHQASLTSSDLGFALRVLKLQETVTPAALITDVAVNASGQLEITFVGENVYMQRAANLNDPNNPASWTTISGPISSGVFNAGLVSAASEAYYRLSDTP